MAANNKTFAQIAREHLNIQTLEPRNRDSLDFHEVSVWQLAKALQAAYDAGLGERNAKKRNALPKP